MENKIINLGDLVLFHPRNELYLHHKRHFNLLSRTLLQYKNKQQILSFLRCKQSLYDLSGRYGLISVKRNRLNFTFTLEKIDFEIFIENSV